MKKFITFILLGFYTLSLVAPIVPVMEYIVHYDHS